MAKEKRRKSDRSLRPPMKSLGRPSASHQENQHIFWKAIARGISTEAASVEAGISPAVGARCFRHNGGMAAIRILPLSGRYLSFSEREEIALLNAQNFGVRAIAQQIGRSPTTVSRELRRNASTRGGNLDYRAVTAQWHATRRSRRPKYAKLAINDVLRQYVQDRLAGIIRSPSGTAVIGPHVEWIGRCHGPRKDRRWDKAWSPEQISSRLRIDCPDDDAMRISHETIYQALYIQSRGALQRELVACLRTGQALRVPLARTKGKNRQFVPLEILINNRPTEAESRLVPGHWEGDLIIGIDSSAIGTLVERSTRFTMLLHLPRMDIHSIQARVKNGLPLAGHGASAVRTAINAALTPLPVKLRRSLTWDQGAEMAQHAQLQIDSGISVYFCEPHSPWQRATNENTNGLLRQYFPKGTDLSRYSRRDLDAVAATLNGRPRKILGWRTPEEVLTDYLEVLKNNLVATTT